MRKLYYAIIVLLLVGLISCDEDNKTVKYNSNDFVGDWNVVSLSIDHNEVNKQREYNILNDTIRLNSDSTASVSSTVYKEDGTFVHYLRTESGTWYYSEDSNFLYVKIKTNIIDKEGKIYTGYPYQVKGIANKLTPKLVVQRNMYNGFDSYIETIELEKIK